MHYDELIEQLKAIAPNIELIKSYWKNSKQENRHALLKKQSEEETFWQHPQQAAISKELQQTQTQFNQYQNIIKNFKDLHELLELFKKDEKELTKLTPEIQQLIQQTKLFKISFLFKDVDDQSNCFLVVNSGAGGTESQDWADMLLRMYLRFCEREHLTTRIIDYQTGEEAGIKSATLYVRGKNPYGLLKSEDGIHRLVRISPFDSSKRRHTSFAAISVSPEVPEIEVTIDSKDLRIDTYRASGAGGQHVNKTDSAVRITHLPSGIVVQCQNERSQLQNKETALKMLKSKLARKLKEEQAAILATHEKKKIEWGSQIRSYILHPYKMVKDHRTNVTSPQPDLVLDGDIIDFIESYLVQIGKMV